MWFEVLPHTFVEFLFLFFFKDPGILWKGSNKLYGFIKMKYSGLEILILKANVFCSAVQKDAESRTNPAVRD